MIRTAVKIGAFVAGMSAIVTVVTVALLVRNILKNS